MVAQLCERNERDKVQTAPESSVYLVCKHNFVVLFTVFLKLKDFIFLFEGFKLCPLLLKGFDIRYSCAFNFFVFERVELVFRPKTGNIALFWQSTNHFIPRIIFILLLQEKEWVNYKYSILPGMLIIHEKLIPEDLVQHWLLCCFGWRKNELLGDSDKHLSSTHGFLDCHTDERQAIFQMENRRKKLGVECHSFWCKVRKVVILPIIRFNRLAREMLGPHLPSGFDSHLFHALLRL